MDAETHAGSENPRPKTMQMPTQLQPEKLEL